jgi:leucyl-tRNA synthetase
LAMGPAAPLSPATLSDEHKSLRRKTHETIKKVSDDYGRRNTFNTAIAAIMELLNDVAKLTTGDAQSISVRHEALTRAILLLSPIAPHICHTLWQALGNEHSVADAAWPVLDESALVRSSIELVIQVNGKVRGKIQVATDAPKEAIEKLAVEDSNVQRFTEGFTIRKIIVVPERLVNIVAN